MRIQLIEMYYCFAGRDFMSLDVEADAELEAQLPAWIRQGVCSIETLQMLTGRACFQLDDPDYKCGRNDGRIWNISDCKEIVEKGLQIQISVIF